MRRTLGWLTISLLAFWCVGGAGCEKAPDPCADRSESCLAVQIEADEPVQVDRIRSLFSVDSGPRRERVFAQAGAQAGAEAASLPIAFPLLLGAQGGSVQLDVIAELRQTPVLLGSGQESVGPGEHKRLVVRLSSDVSNLPVSGPPPRRDAGLVPIPGTSPPVVLLFGGLDADGQPRGDSWEYRSGPSAGFSPISGAAPALRVPTLCADPAGRRVLLVQGAGPLGQPLNDVWQYAIPSAGGAGAWSPLPALRGPSPARARASCAVSSDTSTMQDYLLVFGGRESAAGPQLFDLLASPLPAGPSFMRTATQPAALRTATLIGERSGSFLVGIEEAGAGPIKIWRLDASRTSWSEITAAAATAPSRRTGFAAALDAQGGQGGAKIYLFGGRSDSGTLLDDLYVYSVADQRWTAAAPTQKPSPREGAALAAIPGGTLLLVGGQGGSQLVSDSWLWSGSDWSPL
jgi:hypothetical protein